MANISPTVKIDISIKPRLVEEITMGSACCEEFTAYKSLFQEYQDIFCLVIHKDARPRSFYYQTLHRQMERYHHVWQKKRPLCPSKGAAIKTEIDKLPVVGLIYPITYTPWVSSPVPVNKKQGIIRVCTDFCDLNHTCTKDNFPTLFINQIIDDFVSHEALSFMGKFYGYNQI